MYQETYANQPSVGNLIRIAVVIIVILAYGAIALNTGDMLWFWPKFNEKPNAVTIHCYGEDIKLDPYTEQFRELTQLVNKSLSGSKRWDPLSLSDITYEEYLTHPNMMTMEVSYPSSVRIHTETMYFSNVDTLIIPLDARHATSNSIFGRNQAGDPAAGSLHVESIEPLKDYLHNQGICQPPDESWWNKGDAP